MKRIYEKKLTRDENPLSHLCVYFAAYDSVHKKILMGLHKKSGLWLFNGGHVDKGESLEQALYREMGEEWGFIEKIDADSPSLFTITHIENPKKQICQLHYDIWYFIPFDLNEFKPNNKALAVEFFEWGWKTIDEARSLVRDKATIRGVEEMENLF